MRETPIPFHVEGLTEAADAFGRLGAAARGYAATQAVGDLGQVLQAQAAELLGDGLELVEVATGELSGGALAWALAEAEGRTPILQAPTYGLPARVAVIEAGRLIAWRPQQDWAQGGPLLDQWCKGFGMVQEPGRAEYRAFAYGAEPLQRLKSGPTLLVAACRARVAVMLGDVVRVPAALALPA